MVGGIVLLEGLLQNTSEVVVFIEKWDPQGNWKQKDFLYVGGQLKMVEVLDRKKSVVRGSVGLK